MHAFAQPRERACVNFGDNVGDSKKNEEALLRTFHEQWMVFPAHKLAAWWKPEKKKTIQTGNGLLIYPVQSDPPFDVRKLQWEK